MSTNAQSRPSPWVYAAGSAGVLVMAAAALLAMGRTLWCTCGSIRLWSGNVWGPENSQQLTDPYTFTHITHGVLLYFLTQLVASRRSLGSRFVLATAIESGWEVFENSDFVIGRYRAATMALGYYGDSVVNSVGDVLACGVGFALAGRLPVRAAVALTILLEVGLTLRIRDSLLLNILMLLYPVEAIKHWQLQP